MEDNVAILVSLCSECEALRRRDHQCYKLGRKVRFGREAQHVVIFLFAIHRRIGLLFNAFGPSIAFDRHEPQAMAVTKKHILLPADPIEPRREMPTQIELIFSKPKQPDLAPARSRT